MDIGSAATTNEIALGGILATLVGLFLAIWSLRSQLKAQVDAMREQRTLTSLTAMIPYAEKYEAILERLTPEQQRLGFWGLGATAVNEPALMLAFRRYANLCSQEYYLATNGVFDRKLWQVWEAEAQAVFGSEFGRAAWPEIKKGGHFSSHTEFEQRADEW